MLILALLLCLLVGLAVIPSLSLTRHRKLSAIIGDLAHLEAMDGEDGYAIGENIAFFRSLRSLPTYIVWALTRRRHIDGKRLLEIADLPLPRWEKELYQDLSYVERKNFPGLSKPLKVLLLQRTQEKPDALMLDLGCGGMEVERQVLSQARANGIMPAVTFVGVDLSPQSWDEVQETFKEFGKEVVVKKVDSEDDLKKLISAEQPSVVFYCGDALHVAETLGQKFDVILSSRFRHHLDEQRKRRLDVISTHSAAEVIEYDDFRTSVSWLPPLLTAWFRPVLMNGAVFSQLRQPLKKELLDQRRTTQNPHVLFFSPPGSYAKIFSGGHDHHV